jgi:uncharacterized protein
MKFNLERGSGHTIWSYSTDAITIVSATDDPSSAKAPAQRQISTSLIMTPDVLIEDWIGADDPLDQSHLEQILTLGPEIILLGTGRRITFPAQVLLAHCQQQRVGMEVMDTGAACRTYNVLAAEGRKVCLAVMRI